MSKRALGKGLDALFTADAGDSRDKPELSNTEHNDTESFVNLIPLAEIAANPNQPRKTFDDTTLAELADSIREKGVLQPVLLQKNNNDEYILVAGERRYRAAQLAGLTEIPAIVVSYQEEELLEIALIENIQREDLLPIDEALAYEGLMKTAGLSQEELARKLGKKRSTIANSVRLLKLPLEIQKALQEGILSSGHARAILSVGEDRQGELYTQIVSQGLSVRQAEEAASEKPKGSSKKTGDTKARSKLPAELREMEQKLLDVFGTKIAVKGNLEGGKIEISYYSMEDLERLYEIVEKLSNK